MGAGDIIVVNKNTFGVQANLYDGADDYMLVDAHAVARVSGNDTVGTYTVWVYIDNKTVQQTILSAGDNSSGNEYLKLYFGGGGKLRCKFQHGGTAQWQITQTTGTITEKRWTHVAIVQDGTQPALYIDGKRIEVTNTTSTDLTDWYDELTLVDKFAIGVFESNATHTEDFKGAIGQVQYRNKALSSTEMLAVSRGESLEDDGTFLQLNLTMEDDGTTDSGLGADNGTLVGNAHYGGYVSNWSKAIEENTTGHAAEDMNTVDKGNGFYETIIKRGD